VAAAAARERTGCCWSSSSCYQSKQGPRRPQAGTERYQNIISEMASKYSLNIVKTVAEIPLFLKNIVILAVPVVPLVPCKLMPYESRKKNLCLTVQKKKLPWM
jgi:hypothetical protein